MPMTLAFGEVHVWHRATAGLGAAELPALVAQLSPDERARCERFRFERDQRDYAAAHALLRTALSRYAHLAPAAWQFQQEPDGKPWLVPSNGAPRLAFNLSHTRGFVACAISGGADVGIDVEPIERYAQGVAERYFSPRENQALRQCGSEALRGRRFVELWTLKEAYVKAIGKGLSHSLQTIEFDPTNREAIGFQPPPGVDPGMWTFALRTPTAEHCLAVAVRQDRRDGVTIRMME